METADGATLNGVGVTNGNSIEVFAGSVLTLDQVTTVDNSTGAIAIDGTAMLTLNDASISGGTVTNNGRLTLEGKTALKDGTLLNFGQINVSGTVNELDNEKINNDSAMAILALGVLTLDHLDHGRQHRRHHHGLRQRHADAERRHHQRRHHQRFHQPRPSGSIIAGDIDVTGSSTISNASLNNGKVTIESGVDADAGQRHGHRHLVRRYRGGATIQVDGGDTLTLNGVTINGGTINDFSHRASRQHHCRRYRRHRLQHDQQCRPEPRQGDDRERRRR